MEKPKFIYLVQSICGRKFHVEAASSDQAKRAFCREYGIRPSDYFCGLSALRARRLKPEEIKALKDNEEVMSATLIFIQGMLELSVKTYEMAQSKEIKR